MVSRYPRDSSSPMVALSVSIFLAIFGLTSLGYNYWKTMEVRDPATINSHFCMWRMREACWASPNVSLSTFELLFPVTRAALFQRDVVQGFQPLETRYDVAVLWNAMTRCREIHQYSNESQLSDRDKKLFQSLPSNASVDAWCGASLLKSMETDESQTYLWLLPAEAMHSPFTAHHARFLDDIAEHERKHVGTCVGILALATSLVIMLFDAVDLDSFNQAQAKETGTRSQQLVENRHPLAAPTSQLKLKTEAKEPMDPTWIDLTETSE